MIESRKESRKSGLSTKKKLVFSAVTTLGFFLALESVLALVGLRPVTDTSDPFVGFSKQIPLFEEVTDDAGVIQVRTAGNKLIWFNDQQFPKSKAAGTRRVFCLGGSTTYGRPYDDTTSFCGWMRQLLPYADESIHWEVVNAGGVSYASYRVVAVMEELVRYEPDLFIVYSGQNEFLERRTYESFFKQSAALRLATGALSHTRIWTLLESAVRQFRPTGVRPPQSQDLISDEVDEMLNHTVGPADYHRDDQWHEEVLQHYRFNLRRMVEIARKADAEIVFVVPASNEKDCSPFKSEPSNAVGESDRLKLDEIYNNALDAAADGRDEEAMALFEQTKKIDDQIAHVDYAMGWIQFNAGLFDEAQRSFQNALNHDVCPLRALHEFNDSIRTVAKEENVALVDFESRLRKLCLAEQGHSCLGNEYFLDHVHPTIEAHRDLAVWLIEQLQENKTIGGQPLTQSQIDAVTKRVEGQIDLVAQGVALRNLAKVLHWAGKFHEAEPHARNAIAALGNDAESQLVLADCLRWTNRIDEAVAQCEQLVESNPFYPRGYHLYGDILLDLEQYDRARDALSIAVLGMPDGDKRTERAKYRLAIAHLHLSEFDDACAILEPMHLGKPDDPNLLFHLAQCKAGLNETDAAISMYQLLLQRKPNDVETIVNLGLLLLDQQRYREALDRFTSALKLDPENDRAINGRNVVQQLLH